MIVDPNLLVFVIFRMTKEFVQLNQDAQVKKVLKILGEDFAGSSNPNTRKGGLIGLAAAAIALGKVRESVIYSTSINYVDLKSYKIFCGWAG